MTAYLRQLAGVAARNPGKRLIGSQGDMLQMVLSAVGVYLFDFTAGKQSVKEGGLLGQVIDILGWPLVLLSAEDKYEKRGALMQTNS